MVHRRLTGYDDEVGWTRLDGLLSADQAADIDAACDRALHVAAGDPVAAHASDKPHGGTRRLAEVVDRVPVAAEVAAAPALLAEVTAILGPNFRLNEALYRCPRPGFGAQKLHTDHVDRNHRGPGSAPNLCATAIVALVDFTPDNGSTRVVPGSHRRPDLERQGGNLDRHPDEIHLLGPAGTAFVLSGHLLHSGTENRSAARRPTLQFTYRIR